MDGLTIRQGQNLLNTGRTASEVRQGDLSPAMGSSSPSSAGIAPTGANGKIDGGSFANVLRDAIQETNALQVEANRKAEDLATGQTTNITDVMMSVEKADIALRLMTQVRNKIVDAYQEIMKMQV
jgi:flagellar hook-basal body complex protein FliE